MLREAAVKSDNFTRCMVKIDVATYFAGVFALFRGI